MRDDFAPLSHVALAPGTTFDRLAEPPVVVHLDDPALPLMTDFRKVRAVSTRPHVQIDDALERMKTSGVRLLLVLDDEQRVIGLVSSYDIQGERPIRISQENRVPRSELTVEMVMTPQSRIRVLDMLSVRGAQVGHIVATMRQLELRHVLVVDVDPQTKAQTVRGLFSITELSRRLRLDVIDVMTAAHSLAELRHGREVAG